MSEREIRALQNKFKLWKIMHNKESYCDHCILKKTKFVKGIDGERTCSGGRLERKLTLLGFCHLFLMEENYVK